MTEEEIAVVKGAGEKRPTALKSERSRRVAASAAAIATAEDDDKLE